MILEHQVENALVLEHIASMTWQIARIAEDRLEQVIVGEYGADDYPVAVPVEAEHHGTNIDEPGWVAEGEKADEAVKAHTNACSFAVVIFTSKWHGRGHQREYEQFGRVDERAFQRETH